MQSDATNYFDVSYPSIKSEIDQVFFIEGDGQNIVTLRDITISEDIKEIAEYYGANVPFMRPKEYAEDTSPDIEWVKH